MFKKFREQFKKNIPYDDIYLVNMVKIKNELDEGASYTKEILVSGLSTVLYLNDELKMVSLVDDEQITEYIGELFSSKILKSFSGSRIPDTVGYINKRRLSDLGLIKNLKKKMLLSKRELIKINNEINDMEEAQGRMIVSLSMNEETAKQQLLSQGIVVEEKDELY